MSKIRAFTYNNGPAIGNNGQLGDLAIGRLGDNYDTSPGGKTWWGGADENQFYYIVKDVPASNFPTPVGNSGSAQFWGFERETAGSGPTTGDETNFINLTNNITNNSFTHASSSGEYLFDNGYYTNYPYPIETFDSITTSGSGIFGLNYGTTNEELYYFQNISGVGSSAFPSNPVVSSASFNGGGGSQDYGFSGSLPSTGSSNFKIYNSDTFIDNSNNILYSSVVSNTDNSGAYPYYNNAISRYSLTTKLITHTTRSAEFENSGDHRQSLTLDITRDKLYNLRSNPSSGTTNGWISIYTASNLEYYGEITDPLLYAGNLGNGLGLSVNSNNGDLFILTRNVIYTYAEGSTGDNYKTLYALLNNNQRLENTNFGGTPLVKSQIEFVSSVNSWFFRANLSATSSPNNRAIVGKYTVDGDFSYISLGNAESSGTNLEFNKTNLIYDSTRDVYGPLTLKIN